jgi:prevent-host-death family protein
MTIVNDYSQDLVESANMAKQIQQIGAGEFKAKCLGLLSLVNEKNEEIVITKHGEPIAKLVPFKKEVPSLRGYMKGSIKIKGDIVHSPKVRWHAGMP